MKILVYGAKGWIGSQFIKCAESEKKWTTVAGTARCNDAKSVAEEIDLHKPDAVFSAIGRTHGPGCGTIDYLERKGMLRANMLDNYFAPITLTRTCARKGVYLAQIATGCIFKYDDNHNTEVGFTEDDDPNFFGSSYSTIKGFTDKALRSEELAGKSLVLRIRMPITDRHEPRNFITKITKYAKVVDVPNSMTVLPDLLPHALDLMENNVTGTVNFTNPGTISHNEILDMYTEIVDVGFRYENFSIPEQNAILASERSNNYLDTTLLEALCENVKPIKQAVRECLERFAKKTRILVTGGSGFIGSNFINHVYKTHPEYSIVNLDKLTYCADEANIDAKIRADKKRYKFVKGDVCDHELVLSIMNADRITHVVHFAAESHVDKSFDSSMEFTRTNVLGTHVMLQCMLTADHKIKRFVHISSDEVYGTTEAVADENTIRAPTNVYSCTKAAAEHYVGAYQRSFKLPAITVRMNNAYGPNQYPEKVIPKFIMQVANGKAMTIHGSGKTSRSFMHVSDIVKGIDTVLHKGKINEIYNIGTDREYTVDEVARDVWVALNGVGHPIDKVYVEDRPFNDKRYNIDSKKIEALGWKPLVPFEHGLKATVAWYLSNYDRFTKKMASLEQDDGGDDETPSGSPCGP